MKLTGDRFLLVGVGEVRGREREIEGMGRILDALFGRKSRQVSKLKALLGLTISRLAILRNQRQSRCSQAEADVAHLLLLRHHDRAILRAEMVIKERNMLDVFAMLEGYCYLLTERAFLLHNQKECPEELKEAAAGLTFAASRTADLPELRDVRRIFSSRFGKEFTTAAAELRNNCGVSGKMVQKFSTRQPSLENRAKVAKEIAKEKGIKEEIAEPPPDEIEFSEGERDHKPSLQTKKTQATACDLQDLLEDEKLALRTQEKYKDAGSAAQAAFESAAYAAVAARTAVQLYRSESQRRDCSGDPNNPLIKKRSASVESMKLLMVNESRDEIQPVQTNNWDIEEEEANQSRPRDANHSPSDSSCSSLRAELEKPRGKGIVFDESDEESEELLRLATKALVPVTRAQSFAGIRGINDFRGKFQNQFDADQSSLHEKVQNMSIIAMEPSRKYDYEIDGKNIAGQRSMQRANSFSVRTRT